MTKKRRKQIEELLEKRGQVETKRQLASFITLIEGGKSNVKQADTMEILTILNDLCEYLNPESDLSVVFSKDFSLFRKKK